LLHVTIDFWGFISPTDDGIRGMALYHVESIHADRTFCEVCVNCPS